MKIAMQKQKPCPCYSGKIYSACCQPYHQGVLPENALLLMRSRYAAYALGLADYLIQTTHSHSPHFVANQKQWLQQIQSFSQQVSFDGLDILETQFSHPESFVTFVAHLSKNGKDLTFTERSRFLKEEQAWKYVDGRIGQGCLTLEQIKYLI